MQDLRLVGVHEDGEHLLLSAGGDDYRLAIDEALRTAVFRPTTTRAPGAGEPAEAGLSPREIQARIRAGATAEEVAAESGLGLERIRRYESPVLAERHYIVEQARNVEVAGPLPGHDGYRSAFGDEPATLGGMVDHRIHAFGIEPDSMNWDSWRRSDGSWEIVASFPVPAAATTESIGEEPPARWIFHAARRTIQNANRWAQQLSELETVEGPVPGRRLKAVTDHVFDFEADSVADLEPEDTQDDEQSAESEELLEVLRSRRGQRLGVDEDADDALALMLTQGPVPAAHPRDSFERDGFERDSFDETDDHDDAEPAVRPRAGFPLTLAPAYDEGPISSLELDHGISTLTHEITLSGAPEFLRDEPAEEADGDDHDLSGYRAEEDEDDDEARDDALATRSPADQQADEPRPSTAPVRTVTAGNASVWDKNRAEEAGSQIAESDSATDADDPDEAGPAPEPPKRTIKPKRSSVPSWDEIVFGTKHD
ncbi:septation protein SepH [Arthrobacter sp. NPDC089319]|uniref:septation protein SepH n=1 Tax=Arthrobacter sp. NPDC089319 TaxID=3155915 RepID=UPI00343EA1C0